MLFSEVELLLVMHRALLVLRCILNLKLIFYLLYITLLLIFINLHFSLILMKQGRLVLEPEL